MSVLVIGGDRIQNIKDKLRENGFDIIEHVSGRKKSDKKVKIPYKTDLVLVLTDYVGHRVVELIKEESKKCDKKVVFSKRCWSCMEEPVKRYVEEQLKK